jgi:HD-like signal output (HDOD) protein
VHIEPLAIDEHAEVLELVHSRLGAAMIANWKLPALAAEAGRRHHDYRGAADDRDGYSQIGHAVAVADRVACHLGIGRPARALDDGDREVICSLGIDPVHLLAVAGTALL